MEANVVYSTREGVRSVADCICIYIVLGAHVKKH